MIISICETIRTALENKCEVMYDLTISSQASKQSFHIPAVLVSSSGVMAFLHFDAFAAKGSKADVLTFRSLLNLLVLKGAVGINSIMLYGVCESESSNGVSSGRICSYNAYNDRITYFSFEDDFEGFVECALGDLSCRRQAFEGSELSAVAFEISLLSGKNGDVRKGPDGNYYLKKHGQWHLASEHDPDSVFLKAAVFGCFGAHKFETGKRFSGIAYFLTFGLFGIGWIFDCLSMLIGVYKDSEGKYLLPVSNPLASATKMIAGIGVTVAYVLLCYFGIKLVINVLAPVFNSIVTTNISELSEMAQ